MTNEERIERLRKCATFNVCNPETCDLWYEDDCRSILLEDAAHALEAAYKRIAELEADKKTLINVVKDKSDFHATKDAMKIAELEAQIPKEGVWITTRTEYHDGEIYCSVCDFDAPTEGDYRQVKTNYCPNCGARMTKGEEK